MKKNIKKVLSLGVASALAVTGFAPSFAAVSHFVSQDATGKAYQYGKTELENSYVDGKIGGEGKLYKDYNNAKTLKALNDTKKGYVDYADVENAYVEAKLGGKLFNIDAYTEGDAKPYAQMPDKVYDVSVDANGNISNVEKPVNPDTSKLQITSVKPISDTKMVVKLSKPVDTATSANFTIAGMSIVSAELSKDKTEVTIIVSGAELGKEYTVVAKNLQSNGTVQGEISSKFTMPTASELFKIKMSIEGDKEEIKADNKTSVLVTFDLVDANGDRLDVNNVELKLSTTFGTFAENKVTVQNGKATAIFNSEVLESTKDALLSAVVIEASNKNLINIRAEKTLRLNPNPDTTAPDDKVGISLTDVAADMADRVILYFNKDVDLSKYVADKTTNGYDPEKLEITVKTGTDNTDTDLATGDAVKVKGLKVVPGNSKALYAILDVDTTANNNQHLKDNAKLNVNVKDKTGTVDTNITKTTVLTDARRPSILAVNKDGLNKIVVTFSEPIIGYDTKNSATNLENWVLDGTRLDDAKWGRVTQASVEVGKFDVKTGEDKRNIATIKLGKDSNNNQIYMKAGTHSLQGAKIGDYADMTDKDNNIVNTQTLDFVISEDTNVPTAKVDVQSPEQYVVTFNTAVEMKPSDIKLEIYNTSSNKWDPENKQTINVRAVEDTENKFVVEVKKDWTTVYNTELTKKNYYNDNYRLAIAENSVTSIASGDKNSKIEMLLEGAMKSPDLVSPTIDDITEKTQGTEYIVTMSEPVKFPSGGGSGDSFATPSQGQGGKYETDKDGIVPTPTAQFIKADNSKTVEADVKSNNDPYNKELIAIPKNDVKLEAGEWKLVVRSISDDIGNTAASANKNFTVSGTTVSTEFKVDFAVVDWDGTYATVPGSEGPTSKGDFDYIFVKFTEPVKTTGGQVSALTTTNYTLNGDPLPKGTQITGDIEDLDNKDSIVDSVTIKVPKGTITGYDTTVITVSPYIQNSDGKVLANGGQFKLPYNFKTESKNTIINEKTFREALADKTVKTIKIDADINFANDLVIDKVVNVDTNGFDMTFGSNNITIKTDQSGSINIFNSKGEADPSKITSSLIVKVPNADVSVGEGITLDGNVTIADIAANTFINRGHIGFVYITDPNKSGFINYDKEGIDATYKIVYINTKGEVNLGGKFNTPVEVQKAATLKLQDKVKFEDEMIQIKNTEGKVTIDVPKAVSLPIIKNETINNVAISQDGKTVDLPATDTDAPVVEEASVKVNGTVITKNENADSLNITLKANNSNVIEDAKVVVSEKSGMSVKAGDTTVQKALDKFMYNNFEVTQVENGKITVDTTGVNLTNLVKAALGTNSLDFTGKREQSKTVNFELKDKAGNVSTFAVTINIVKP